MKFFRSAIGKSIALHIGLIILLAVSVSWEDEPVRPQQISMPIVQATMVDQAEIEQQFQRIEDQKRAAARAEQERLDRIERQKQAEIKRKQEAERARKLKIEQERKAKEKKLREEQQRQKKLAEEKERLRREEDARKKAEDERKKREAELKAQREAEERKRREEAARQEQQRLLQEQMAAQQRVRQQQISSELEKYKGLIYAKIVNGLYGDDSLYGKTCRVKLRLASTGFVTDYTWLGGDDVLCRAVRRSLERAGKLPISTDPDVNRELRDITLTIQPVR